MCADEVKAASKEVEKYQHFRGVLHACWVFLCTTLSSNTCASIQMQVCYVHHNSSALLETVSYTSACFSNIIVHPYTPSYRPFWGITVLTYLQTLQSNTKSAVHISRWSSHMMITMRFVQICKLYGCVTIDSTKYAICAWIHDKMCAYCDYAECYAKCSHCTVHRCDAWMCDHS